MPQRLEQCAYQCKRGRTKSFQACTIGFVAFIAEKSFVQVLWIFACKVLPFRSVPISRKHRGRFCTINGSHSLYTPPWPLSLVTMTTNEKSTSSFASNGLNCSLVRGSDSVINWYGASRALPSTMAKMNMNTLIFRIFGVDALLQWDQGVSVVLVVINLCQNLKWLKNHGIVYLNPGLMSNT